MLSWYQMPGYMRSSFHEAALALVTLKTGDNGHVDDASSATTVVLTSGKYRSACAGELRCRVCLIYFIGIERYFMRRGVKYAMPAQLAVGDDWLSWHQEPMRYEHLKRAWLPYF